MRHIRPTRFLSLCLLAAVAIAATAAASASAAPPELGRCVAAPSGGKYKNSACTKATASKPGKFEWFPGPGAHSKFTMRSGRTTLQTSGGFEVVCEGDVATGEYVGGNTVFATVSLFGCGDAALKLECNTEGAKPGEVVSFPLEGEFGFVKGTKDVGLDFKSAEGGAMTIIADFECGPFRVVMMGSVIPQFTKVDDMAETAKLEYAATVKKGIATQKFQKFVGGPLDVPEVFSPELTKGFEQGAETGTEEVLNGEALEVNTVA